MQKINYYDMKDEQDDELKQYAKYIGMDINEDQEFLYIAKEGLNAELPDEWEALATSSGEILYQNKENGVQQWAHPLDEYYKQKFRELKHQQQQSKMTLTNLDSEINQNLITIEEFNCSDKKNQIHIHNLDHLNYSNSNKQDAYGQELYSEENQMQLDQKQKNRQQLEIKLDEMRKANESIKQQYREQIANEMSAFRKKLECEQQMAKLQRQKNIEQRIQASMQTSSDLKFKQIQSQLKYQFEQKAQLQMDLITDQYKKELEEVEGQLRVVLKKKVNDFEQKLKYKNKEKVQQFQHQIKSLQEQISILQNQQKDLQNTQFDSIIKPFITNLNTQNFSQQFTNFLEAIYMKSFSEMHSKVQNFENQLREQMKVQTEAGNQFSNKIDQRIIETQIVQLKQNVSDMNHIIEENELIIANKICKEKSIEYNQMGAIFSEIEILQRQYNEINDQIFEIQQNEVQLSYVQLANQETHNVQQQAKTENVLNSVIQNLSKIYQKNKTQIEREINFHTSKQRLMRTSPSSQSQSSMILNNQIYAKKHSDGEQKQIFSKSSQQQMNI